MNYITVDEFNFNSLAEVEILKRNKRKKGSDNYLNIVTAFDIEASRLVDIEQSVMYIWQFQYGTDVTVVGRYWSEFLWLFEKISEHIKDVAKLVVYVHNLSYEFQFLKGIYKFQPDDVFCTDSRKILKCTMYECIEFRCSYYLTNMSLDRFLKKYNVENKKLSGEEFNYNKVRYPWTELSESELEYCINDVKGLVQALIKQLKSDDDNIQTVPLTSTGYVRRDVKEAMKQFNYEQLHDMLPDVKVYKLLREAFRGGDTLSNRWNTDEIIENVKSVDIVSSYPSSMLTYKYPMTKFYKEDVSDFEKLYNSGTRALLFRVVFIDLDVKDIAEGHLYLSRDKCRNIENGTFVNGRILCADYLETTLTDIDYEILNRRYKYKEKYITVLYSARYKKLPSMFRHVIMNYYRIKTELKGVSEEDENYYYYMKNKEKLNSSYGMTVEDPAKDEVKFINGEYIKEDKPLNELLTKNNHSAFLNYAWGVWVTAYSRKRLADGIDVVTKKGTEPMNFIYSDTDSIKYVGDVNFSNLNKQLEEEAVSNKAYATDKYGEVHFMGVFEDEGYKLPNRFKTLGAKKYVLEDKDKKLHITIAGVNKIKGAKELERIENFSEGFIFKEGGGTESVFNDNVNISYLTLDGKKLEITDNVVIRDSTYTLGITAEYRKVLDGLVDIKYSDVDIEGLYKVKE